MLRPETIKGLHFQFEVDTYETVHTSAACHANWQWSRSGTLIDNYSTLSESVCSTNDNPPAYEVRTPVVTPFLIIFGHFSFQCQVYLVKLTISQP